MITADLTTDATSGEPAYRLQLTGADVLHLTDPAPGARAYDGNPRTVAVFEVLVTVDHPYRTELVGGAMQNRSALLWDDLVAASALLPAPLCKAAAWAAEDLGARIAAARVH